MSIVQLLIKKIQKIRRIPNKVKAIEEKSIFKKLWQGSLKKFKDLLEKRKKGKILKKKNKEKSLDKTKKQEEQKTSDKFIEPINSLDGIYRIIQQYEELAEKEFFVIILNAKACLREWRSELAQALTSQQSIPDAHLETLSVNLSEIYELYQESSSLLNKMINKCNEYTELVKDINRTMSPQQKLNEITICLDKLKRNLKSQQKTVDFNNDNDFKFLNSYVKDRETKLLSR